MTLTASVTGVVDSTQAFTLTVGSAPSFTSATSQSFETGFGNTFLVQTAGFPKSTVTETGALATGVSFQSTTSGTGVLSGTPAAGQGGNYVITFTATNGVTPTATQTFTLTVFDAPAITSAFTKSFTLGSADTFTVGTTGFPTNAITETGTLPTGVSFVDNGNGTATLAGTPATGTQGVYGISLNADNGIGSDATQVLTLTVGIPPTVSSANNTTFTVGTGGTFSVTTSGFPNAALSETGNTLPSGVSFTDNGNGTATLAGTPAASTGGVYTITIAAREFVYAECVAGVYADG